MAAIQLTRKRPTTICNGWLCKTIVLIVVAAGVVCDNTVSNVWLIDGSILFSISAALVYKQNKNTHPQNSTAVNFIVHQKLLNSKLCILYGSPRCAAHRAASFTFVFAHAPRTHSWKWSHPKFNGFINNFYSITIISHSVIHWSGFICISLEHLKYRNVMFISK